MGMPLPLHVLIVEDSDNDAQLILRELARGGYSVQHERVESAAAMQAALQRQAWDVVISDHSMPFFDSAHALQLLKASGQDLPFLIVSGSLGEEEAVAILKQGAHDFLLKGNLTRLVPAIQRELRDAEERRERRRAEAALREAEARYRLLVERIPAITYIVSSEPPYNTIYISPQIEQLLGFTPNEWRADPDLWQRQIHPDDLERILAEDKASREEKRPFIYDYRILTRDGRVVWLHDETHHISEPGLTPFSQGIEFDITELKQTEAALRESEERFRLVVDSAPSGIVVVDIDGKIKLVNDRTQEMFGYGREELLGKPIEMLVPERSQGAHASLREQYMTHPSRRRMAARRGLMGRHKDGHEIPLEIGLTPFQGTEGLSILALITDITEHMHAEEALHEAEFKYRTLVEQLPMVVYSNAKEDIGKTTYVSPQIETILGYTPQEWLDDPTFWQKILHPDDRQAVQEKIEHSNRTGEVFDMEYRMLARDGHIVWLRDQAVPVTGASGHPLYWHGLMSDVTERKQREREVEAIARLSTALRATQTVKEVLPRLLDETLSLLEAEAGSIWLYDDASDEMSLAIHRGWGNEPLSKYPRGQNIPDIAVVTGEAIVAREFRNDARIPEQQRARMPEGAGGACVPLIAGQKTIGAMFVNVRLPREITAVEVQMLNALADIGGNAIQRASLFDQTVKQVDRLAALRSIDIAISSSFDLKMMLNVVLDSVTRQLHVDAAAVLLLRPESLILEFTAGQGFWTRAIETTPVSMGEGLAGKTALERKIVYVDNLQESNEVKRRPFLLTEEKFVSYYGVPLVSKGKVKGVLELFNRSGLKRDGDWLQFLDALAGQTAIAIDSSGTFQDLQRSNLELALAYDATIEGWSHALDLRDKETEGHTLRVTETALKLAQAMGVEDEVLIHLRRGALLHDIGKMGVPDSILLKPGKLTDEEWVVMRKHPQLAYDMLMPISYLRPALDIPYCHHEKWDGTGYPRGLKGEQIPLAARIFSVVDVWDALSSDRPYRPAWKAEEVVKYLEEQSGKYFDPRVAQVFLGQIAR